ncbi:tyrosine-type recombinase/integrase [Alsobacter sp. R-9]
MAKGINRLSAKAVATAKAGKHSDGGGLYLIVSETGSRKWVLRYAKGGKPREFGLGSARDVTLADARVKADTARKALANGAEPNAAPAVPKAVPSFGEEADALIASMEPAWRNPKHRAQWRVTLGAEPYTASKVRTEAKAHAEHVKALTALRAKPVDAIDTADVLAVLKPLWQAAPETASRLRGRIEAVLGAATAKGHRAGANPAQWRNHLDRLLPKRARLTRGHHAAMPYAEVPAFVARLRGTRGLSALALEFTILTAARSGEVLGARWSEIDLAAKVWTVPAKRMKAGREHRVPLSDRALAILEDAAKLREDDGPGAFVFPGQKPGRGLSSMALEMVLRRLDVDCTVHGFRSAFRDWCGEETSFPRDLAEAALAHTLKDKVEAAYRRGDALEKRRKLMAAWSDHCSVDCAANVVAIRRDRVRR